MRFDFRGWFSKQLPAYFKDNDTYKDVNGKGLLERYLDVFGKELYDKYALDEPVGNTSNDLLKFLKNVSPLDADPLYLNYIAYTLANPPDLLGDPTEYRKLLSNIVSVYKIKGTKASYELFFAILGYIVRVKEYKPISVKFDDAKVMDIGLEMDHPFCELCTTYDLIIKTGLANPTTPLILSISQTTMATLRTVVDFNEPVNATLRHMVLSSDIWENVINPKMDDVTIKRTLMTKYDRAPFKYDNGDTMDTREVLQTYYRNETTTPV